MRFDCYKSLNDFIKVLGEEGYQAPFSLYDASITKLDKHIHNYKVNLTSTLDGHLVLNFTINSIIKYTIELYKPKYITIKNTQDNLLDFMNYLYDNSTLDNVEKVKEVIYLLNTYRRELENIYGKKN